MKKLIPSFALLLGSVLCMPATPAQAQGVTLPQASQKATVMQRIGLTDVTIHYSSPAVNDREIWGTLVPYNEGKPFPWRAGANENTIIKFTDDVTIEGQPLKAGTYGLHMIPSEKEWTIIFSNTSTAWGSFFYNQDEDALRVQVVPAAGPFTEWLNYSFEDRQSNSAMAVLQWEKLKVGFKVGVNAHEVVLNNIRGELKSLPFWGWQGPHQAAVYCLQNNINHDEALQWADLSISRQQNFNNLSVKSGLLRQKGNDKEADEVMEKAIPIANKAQLNAYGYRMMNAKKFDKALVAFQLNVEHHPEDPNLWDSLGEGYYRSGDKEKAIKTLKKSLSMNPPDAVKANSIAMLKEMGVDYN